MGKYSKGIKKIVILRYFRTDQVKELRAFQKILRKIWDTC